MIGIVLAIIFAVIIFILLVIFVINILSNNSFYKKNSYSAKDKYYQDNKEAFGEYGEKVVADLLNDFYYSFHSYPYNNFTFEDEHGFSTNIDHILISKGGIFIIETKSNKGYIYGDDNREYWKAIKDNGEEKQFKNPVKQNEGHIKHLKRMFKTNPPKVYSLIIFPFANSLDGVDSKYVFSLHSAQLFIADKINQAKYSDDYVERMKNQFDDFKYAYGISLEEHKENLKRYFNNDID